MLLLRYRKEVTQIETMGERIKRLRTERNLTQEELGNRFGLKRAAINKYEKGNVENMKRSIIEEMSLFFNVTPSYLMALDDFLSPIEQVYKQLNVQNKKDVYSYASKLLENQDIITIEKKSVPLVGSTAANPTELAYGDTIYDETVETNVPHTADCALVIQGDSMEPDFMDGSIVFYKLQKNVESGELAIIEIEGNGVTFKKVCFDYENKQVILKSLNEKYDDRVVSPDQIRVVGKVIQ